MFTDWLNKVPGSKKSAAIPFLKKGKNMNLTKTKIRKLTQFTFSFTSSITFSLLKIYCSVL